MNLLQRLRRLRLPALAVLLALVMTACAVSAPQGSPAPSQSAPTVSQPAPAPEPTPEPEAELPDPEGYYYDVEGVVRYLDAYGCLPGNFITKDEARALGWSGGSVERFREGAAIGGDRFGNREGLLPRADGRSYTECDIDTLGADSRGAKRLVFSGDGLYFYTEDHYEHFEELYVTEEGDVVWK